MNEHLSGGGREIRRHFPPLRIRSFPPSSFFFPPGEFYSIAGCNKRDDRTNAILLYTVLPIAVYRMWTDKLTRPNGHLHGAAADFLRACKDLLAYTHTHTRTHIFSSARWTYVAKAATQSLFCYTMNFDCFFHAAALTCSYSTMHTHAHTIAGEKPWDWKKSQSDSFVVR